MATKLKSYRKNDIPMTRLRASGFVAERLIHNLPILAKP